MLVLKKKITNLNAVKSILNEVREPFDSVDYANHYMHEIMLADTKRVTFYKDMIQKYVTNKSTVIDLGTGSGILSFFAAKKNPRRIYAIDNSKIIKQAQEIAKDNDIRNITFIKKCSHKLKLKEKADILIQEQMGNYLFDEDIIKKVIDVRKRLLKNNGKILPSKFEFYIEPMKIIDNYKVPYLCEFDMFDIDFKSMNKYFPKRKRYVFYSPNEYDYFLCEPQKLLSFDLEAIDSEAAVSGCYELSKKVIRDGRLDGFCIYFKVLFDKKIGLDLSPFEYSYRGWKTPFYRVTSRELKKGDTLNLEISLNKISKPETWNISIK